MRIEAFKGHKLLNRRGEWGQNLPPKLTLEGNLDSPDGPKRKSDHKQVKTRSQSNENQREGQVRNDPGQESSHATGQVQSQDEDEATGPPPQKRRKLPLKCGKPANIFCPPIRSKQLTVKEIMAKMKLLGEHHTLAKPAFCNVHIE